MLERVHKVHKSRRVGDFFFFFFTVPTTGNFGREICVTICYGPQRVENDCRSGDFEALTRVFAHTAISGRSLTTGASTSANFMIPR